MAEAARHKEPAVSDEYDAESIAHRAQKRFSNTLSTRNGLELGFAVETKSESIPCRIFHSG